MPRSPRIQSQTPIDHDMIVSKDGVIYVVVGNNHPPGFTYAYPKYKPTTRKTPWCNRITCYERIPLQYEVLHIYHRSMGLVDIYHDPKYSSRIIGLKNSRIKHILNAKARLKEIISSPKTILETILVELVDEIRSLGVNTSSLGITGSILANIHNDKLSDIDLVVYGKENALRIIEDCKNILKPLRGKLLEEWIRNHSKAYNLPKDIIEKYYTLWRRGIYQDRVVSIVYVDDEAENNNYFSEIYYYLGPSKLVVLVEPGQVESVFYPSRAKALVLDVEKGYRIDKGSEVTIVSYESLYSKPLFSGGKLLVEGALYMVKGSKERYELLVGVAEHRGFIVAL